MSGIPSRSRQLIVFLLGMALSAVVVVLIFGVVTSSAIRTTQQTNAPKIDKTAETLAVVKRLAEKIDSCTDPSGECAKRGQRNQAKAIGSIRTDTRDVIVATLACRDRGVRGFEPVARCVDKALALADVAHHR